MNHSSDVSSLKEVSVVDQKLNAAKDSCNHLDNVIESLFRRLSDVLTPEMPMAIAADGGGQKAVSQSPLADQIEMIGYGVGSAVGRLEYLLRRLEV